MRWDRYKECFRGIFFLHRFEILFEIHPRNENELFTWKLFSFHIDTYLTRSALKRRRNVFNGTLLS